VNIRIGFCILLSYIIIGCGSASSNASPAISQTVDAGVRATLDASARQAAPPTAAPPTAAPPTAAPPTAARQIAQYPQQVRDNFVRGCTGSGGRIGQCLCLVDRAQQTWDLEQFAKIEQKMLDGQPPSELAEFRQMAASCAGAKNPDYPKQVQNNFIKACIGGGGTNALCSCSLDKIQQQWSIEQYMNIEQQMTSGSPPPELAAMRRMSAECASGR
jgi:hypothetical protein